MEPHILAIDLGTSGPKVALVSTDGAIVATEFEPTRTHLLDNGGAEQDPAEWWQAIGTAARRLMQQRLIPSEGIAGVCCTAQWSGTVAVDAHGQPLMNAVIWMDTRGSRYIRDQIGGPITFAGYSPRKLARWLRLTGGAPAQSGKDSLAHILFLRHERPDVFQRAALFLEPKDYINLRLTGRRAASYDSIALHWLTDNRDLSHVRYDAGLLRRVGLSREKFPELRPAADVLGPLEDSAAAHLGVPKGIPVVMGTPDMQSAAIGSGAVGDYEGHLYVGTSSWITCHVPFKKTDLIHNMASLPSAVPQRYFVADEQESAGACLSFLRDQLLCVDDALTPSPTVDGVYPLLDALASQAAPGSEGVLFAPWLYGERTPIEDHTARAVFFNLSLRTTRAHLVRSVLEGVAFNSRWLLGYVERFIGRPFSELRFIGGGARSELWCQIFADVLNRRVLQVADPLSANARGAGMLGAVALGLMRWDQVPACVPISRAFEPRTEHQAVYQRQFDAFIELYRRNRRLFARLNAG